MKVIELLSPDAASHLLERVRALDFVDGRDSAHGSARDRKSNTQARKSGAEYDSVNADVLAALASDSRIQDFAFPRHFSRILVNRYGVGDTYGLHVDRALARGQQQAMRTDLSYTLFLTPLDEYSGGELQIATSDGMKSFRLNPGELVVYPTGQLHQVTPVTSGERTSIVGWIQSWMSDPHYRELMTKLRSIQGSIEAGSNSALVRVHLGEVVENLIRYGASH